jgi:hypothetical protein
MIKIIALFILSFQLSVLAGWEGCYFQSKELMKNYPDGRSEPSGTTLLSYFELEENHRINQFSKHSNQDDIAWHQSGVWFCKDDKVYYLLERDKKIFIGKLTGIPSKEGIADFKDWNGRLGLQPTDSVERIPAPVFPHVLPESAINQRLQQLKKIVTDFPAENFEGTDSEEQFWSTVHSAVQKKDAAKLLALTYFDNVTDKETKRELSYFFYSSFCLRNDPECKPYEQGEKHLEYLLTKYGFPENAASLKALLMDSSILTYGKINDRWCFIKHNLNY